MICRVHPGFNTLSCHKFIFRNMLQCLYLYSEEMEDFIEDDRRCDCDKTDSCRKCGEQCDINCNEAFLCSGECAAKEIKTKMLIAPFW